MYKYFDSVKKEKEKKKKSDFDKIYKVEVSLCKSAPAYFRAVT